MTSDRWQRIESLYHEALARGGAEREAFLDKACAGDEALHREVESLLAQAVAAEGFLETPAGPAPLVGRQLGPYTITARIGAGGMGEVYRARDTKLRRDVAIKVLPPFFTSDPDRLARFEREARLLASLNHPHVGAIYGMEDEGGVRALVLELVEGPTLEDRLAAGPLPVRDALNLARQIAEALEAAHESGIIHRDLKPANIKITPAGAVKVLDFGLAKSAIHSGRDASRSPTVTSGRTREGMILGTAAYMSPEQARGQPVDKRTDIWAFGCVLYEMLSGRRPFQGDTVSDAIAQVLEREPDWDALPPAVPEPIRKLLKRCLRKDPADRLRDIADARLEIEDVIASPGGDTSKARSLTNTRRWWWAAAGVAATVVAVDVGFSALRQASPSSAPAPIEFGVNLPESQLPALGVAVSPDGRRMALGIFGATPQIWLHSFDSSETRPMPGTEGGGQPFWSPDGSAIGFFSGGKLRRINPEGGPATVVCDISGGGTGTWSVENVILFATMGKLYRVSASGGTAVPVEVQETPDVISVSYPDFLSDGRHFIYHARRPGGGMVRLGSLDSNQAIDLVESDYPAAFVRPSHLLFVRGTSLVTRTLDPRNLSLSGAVTSIAANVTPGFLDGRPGFSASETVLAFARPRGGDTGQLTWFDRAGRAQSAFPAAPDGEYLNPAISPTGEQVAVNAMDPQTGNWDIWVMDLARGIPFRVTTDPARDTDPIWSPDGKAIVFASNRGGRFGLYRKSVGGSEPEERLLSLDNRSIQVLPSDWSRDGKFILYAQAAVNIAYGQRSVWALPLSGDHTPVQLLDGQFSPLDSRLSPDGKWLAYSDFSAGSLEVYVRSFLVDGPQLQISHGGGVHPRWTRDGHEIVYWAVPGGVSAVDFEAGSDGLRAGLPKILVSAPVLSLIDGRTHYDATPDGKRFLVRQPAGPRGPAITVILNWMNKLGR